MDHIPMPSQPIHDQIQVPLRCSPGSYIESKPISFSAYPESQGQDVEQILIGDIGADPDVVEAFLQQWLFFGLIYGVVNSCGTVVTTFDDFIYADEQGVRYVTTKPLPELIDRWKVMKDQLTLESQIDVLEQVNDILAEARYFIGRFTFLAPSVDFDLLVEESILLSIIILGETLEFSKSNIFKFQSITTAPSAPMSLWGNRHELGWLLRTDGCCPNHVEMLEATVSAGTMYYIYLGGFIRDQKDHSQCSTQKCLAYQVDVSTYVTAHCSPGCDCSYIEPPMEKIRTILSDGGIPVISLASPETSLDLLDVDAVKVSGSTTYVAISHVWSDGLGNPNSNSLPHCQLQRLRNLALTFFIAKDRTVADRIMIWIDTLCVPLDEPLRGRAIELIQSTFEQASSVLVLDQQLEKLSSKVSYTENMIRVSCCGWLRRLWTFLEGVIASKLFITLKDEVVEVTVWQLARFNDPSTGLWNLVSTDASQFWWLLRRLNRLDSSQRVARLWNALQWRSTSRPSDEHICVASLFGLDVSEIVRTPVRQRMKKLLEMQQSFPPGIVFMNTKRLSEEGLSWAPTSFLARQPNELGLIIDDKPPAYLGNLGLFVEYSGFLLTTTKTPISPTFILINQPLRSAYVVMWQDDDGGIPWQHAGCHTMKRPALILRYDLTLSTETIALLVDIYNEEDNCLYVRRPTRVAIRAEPDDVFDSHLEGLTAEVGLDVDEYLYVTCEALEMDQKWCIA